MVGALSVWVYRVKMFSLDVVDHFPGGRGSCDFHETVAIPCIIPEGVTKRPVSLWFKSTCS